MAVTQSPTLYGVSTFDANNAQVFEYIWDGPSSAHAKLVISDEIRGTIVAQIVNDGGLRITVPALTLSNNQTYNAYVVLLDEDLIPVSGNSNSIKFQCFTTPTFKLVSETDADIPPVFNLNQSQYRFRIKYVQAEGDFLSQVKFVLYDINNAVIQDKETHYFSFDQSDSSGIFYVSELFTGFINDMDYKIRVTGLSFSGIHLDTGYIVIRVNYEAGTIYAKLEPTNQTSAGTIRLQSNFIDIRGRVVSGNPEFIDNKELDVREDRVIFDNGF